ncbi:MAG: sugar transferase, partial [Clostridia bacterium]
GKRILDFLLALIALIGLFPLLLLIALWVKFDSPGPVLFKQKRVGRGKESFFIYKFRTMYADTPSDVPTHLLKNAKKRITRAGAHLRKTSLDELAQLVNILKGEMAIVGPRPALLNQYDLIAERDKYGANAVRPGLTGLAQVNGRDELPIPVKAKYDGDYVQNIRFLLDAQCVLKTALAVFKGDGVVEGADEKPPR